MKSASNTYGKELEQLLEAQEVAELGSFEWNLLTDDVRLSPQLDKILNLKSGTKFPGFLQHVYPSDRARVKEAIDNAINDSGQYDCEFRYNTNASEKVLWSKGRVIYEQGKATVIRGTIMNVTDRHHMIHRLQRSQELYKQAQAATHIGNWSWELVTDKISWSDELYRIFGLEPQSETMSLERFRNFLHREDKEGSKERLSNLVQSKGRQEYINRIILDNQETKIVQVKREVLSDEDGKPYKVIGTCQDITEKQLLLEKLERSEHFIKHIADASPTILYLFDALEGKIVYINNEITNILGWLPEEILNMGSRVIAEVYHPDDFRKIGERLRQYKNEQRPRALFHFECRMREKSGGWRWMLMRETIYSTGSDQKITEILGAALD
ncbi:MAG: PAS domain-containing protein, partial [Flavitalea sp.]